MHNFNIPLSWQIILAAMLAIVASKILPSVADIAGNFTPVYINILTILLVPYVFCAIISACTSVERNAETWRLILKCLSVFVAMEMAAISMALIVSNLIFPHTTIKIISTNIVDPDTSRYFGDTLMSFFPSGLIDVITQSNLPATIMLGCIFGMFANQCGDQTRIFITNLFNSGSEVLQLISKFVAALSPLGIFCALCKISRNTDFVESFLKITPLATAALITLAIHSLALLPLFLKTTTKCYPYRILRHFASVLFTSSCFSSSTLAVPLAISRMKSETGISPRVANFSMPILSVLNFNGTSIFVATAILYVAQAYGITLSAIEQIILVFAISFITLATPSCPLKLTTITYPLVETMGVPIEGIGIIAICETLFGMLCSLTDTWANIVSTAIVSATEGDKIMQKQQ